MAETTTVQSLEAQLAAINKQLGEAKQAEKAKREVELKSQRDQITKQFADRLFRVFNDEAKAAIKAADCNGVLVSWTTDPNGGPEVASVSLVAKSAPKAERAASTKAAGESTGTKRDLKALFEQFASAEDRAEYAAAETAGKSKGTLWAIMNKVATKAGHPG